MTVIQRLTQLPACPLRARVVKDEMEARKISNDSGWYFPTTHTLFTTLEATK